jgi:hypothetical protein
MCFDDDQGIISHGSLKVEDRKRLSRVIRLFSSAMSLVAAIQRALLLLDRPEIRQKCRERISTFTIEKAAEEIAKVFACVAG